MAHPLLCSTVAESDVAQLRRARDVQAQAADVVELRLDALAGPFDVVAALAGRNKPVIVTCRSRTEGGWFKGSEDERRRILAQALKAGAEFVDVEWSAPFCRDIVAATGGRRVVLSMHDFNGVPRDLEARVEAMLAEGSEVVKIAVTAGRLSDCLALKKLSEARPGRLLALIAMGPRGTATRVLPGRFGSVWTYAGSAAPGQLSVEDLISTYCFRQVTDATAVYGVAGSPVARSLSPVMHNASFRGGGFDAIYLPLDTDDADDLFAFANAVGLAGASVTAPLKQQVAARVSGLDDVARRAGAVNTLTRTGRGWMGANTDVAGFLAPLGEHVTCTETGPGLVSSRAQLPGGFRAAVLGAGGAARAVVLGLASLGARVSVYARRLQAAQEVARLAGGAASGGLPAAGSWDLLVNTTPVGAGRTAETPVPAELLGADGDARRFVYDLVSNPPVTRLLADARAAGCVTISGLEMLVAQAERQAEMWTGCRPTAGLMMDAALAALRKRRCD